MIERLSSALGLPGFTQRKPFQKSKKGTDLDAMLEDPEDKGAAPDGGSPLREAPSRFLASSHTVQLGCWFLIVLVIKHASLVEPPVWDSAMGVFPAAIHLYETGFDIRGLLQQGNWWVGGPNVHSLSLLTWLIAVVMKLTDSPWTTFLILHLLTFALFAWTLMLFTRVLRSYGLADSTVLAAAGFLLLMPVVLVQAGYIYTESLVLAASVAAWAFWREDRRGLAVFACVLGIFIKPTAVAIAAAVFGVLLLSARPLRARTIGLLASIPAAFFVNRSLAGWLGAAPSSGGSWGEPRALMTSLFRRLDEVPDLKWLFFAGLISSIVYVAVRLWRDRSIDLVTRDDPDSRSRLICLAMPLAFAAGLVASIFHGHLFLPRYLVPVVPFAIGCVLLLATLLRAERIALVLLVVGCLGSALNYHGRFYTQEYGSFSLVERSHAYRDFHALQIEAIEFLEAKPEQVPAYVTREVDYMISHRMMGYVSERIANTHPIYVPPHHKQALREFPDEFFLLRTNVGHGGYKMGRLVREAETSRGYEIGARMFERAGFRAVLYRIRRVRGQG